MPVCTGKSPIQGARSKQTWISCVRYSGPCGFPGLLGFCILGCPCAGGSENRIIARIKLKRPCRPYGTGDILQAWRILPAGKTLYNAVPRCEALSFCSYPAFCENFYGNRWFYDMHVQALSCRGCPPAGPLYPSRCIVRTALACYRLQAGCCSCYGCRGTAVMKSYTQVYGNPAVHEDFWR